jgi:type III secretion protein L
MARLIWLPITDAALGDGRAGFEHGIVKAAQVERVLELQQAEQALQQTGQVALEQARAQAAALLAQAEAKVAEVCAQAELRSAQDWHQRQGQMAARHAERQRSLHRMLADVVTTAVERMVQVQDRSALYLRALQTVQGLTQDLAAMILRVSPTDASAAQAGLEDLREENSNSTKLKLVIDHSLPAGSCIFESDTGMLDASLQTQLQALHAAMDRAVKRALMESSLDEEPEPELVPESEQDHNQKPENDQLAGLQIEPMRSDS